MEIPRLECIGFVRNSILSREQAPKNYDISDHQGTLEIDPGYLDALQCIQPGQTIVVLFWLHKADRSVRKVYPRGDRSRGLHGVFATRSPARPNPIAISELKVLQVEDNILHVSGFDVLDGTPVLDIKKKVS